MVVLDLKASFFICSERTLSAYFLSLMYLTKSSGLTPISTSAFPVTISPELTIHQEKMLLAVFLICIMISADFTDHLLSSISP